MGFRRGRRRGQVCPRRVLAVGSLAARRLLLHRAAAADDGFWWAAASFAKHTVSLRASPATPSPASRRHWCACLPCRHAKPPRPCDDTRAHPATGQRNDDHCFYFAAPIPLPQAVEDQQIVRDLVNPPAVRLKANGDLLLPRSNVRRRRTGSCSGGRPMSARLVVHCCFRCLPSCRRRVPPARPTGRCRRA